MPGTVLGAGDTSVTNTQSLSLRSSQSVGRGNVHKHIAKELHGLSATVRGIHKVLWEPKGGSKTSAVGE